MNAIEKRQAQRIVRNALHPERHFFELVGELQQAREPNAAEYDWQSAMDHLLAIQDALPVLFDLVRNVQREMKGAPTP
jgi:hypothetical protein